MKTLRFLIFLLISVTAGTMSAIQPGDIRGTQSRLAAAK